MTLLDKITRRTAAEWAALNPVVGREHIALESDTGKGKEGDGNRRFNALAYIDTSMLIHENDATAHDSSAIRDVATGETLAATLAALPSRYGPAASLTGKASRVARVAGNLSLTSTSWADTDGTNLDIVLTVDAGQWVKLGVSGSWGNEAQFGFLDFATIVSSAVVNTMSPAGYGATSVPNGILAWQGFASEFTSVGGDVLYQVQAGDVVSGQVRFRLRHRVSGTKTLQSTANTPLLIFGHVIG